MIAVVLIILVWGAVMLGIGDAIRMHQGYRYTEQEMYDACLYGWALCNIRPDAVKEICASGLQGESR